MRHLLLIAAAFLISAFPLNADGTWTAQAASDAMSEPGAHLVLLLDAAEARAHWLSTMRDEVRARLRKARVGIGGIALVDNAVRVRLAKPEDTDAAQRALTDIAPAVPSGILERFLSAIGWWVVNDVTVAKHDGGSITVTPTEVGLERRMSSALDSAVSIAGRRLAGMGVVASAVRMGRDQIYVHAAALQDTAALKELLSKSARLGFHEVHATMTAEEALQGHVPIGFKIYPAPSAELLLREIPVIRGSDLADAQAFMDQRTGEPMVSFRFAGSGTRTFARFTSENIGRPFAIVLDDVVLSAPVIREPILDGSGQVSGNFTVEQANQLAVLLRAGTLPAKLTVVEERVVPRPTEVR